MGPPFSLLRLELGSKIFSECQDAVVADVLLVEEDFTSVDDSKTVSEILDTNPWIAPSPAPPNLVETSTTKQQRKFSICMTKTDDYLRKRWFKTIQGGASSKKWDAAVNWLGEQPWSFRQGAWQFHNGDCQSLLEKLWPDLDNLDLIYRPPSKGSQNPKLVLAVTMVALCANLTSLSKRFLRLFQKAPPFPTYRPFSLLNVIFGTLKTTLRELPADQLVKAAYHFRCAKAFTFLANHFDPCSMLFPEAPTASQPFPELACYMNVLSLALEASPKAVFTWLYHSPDEPCPVSQSDTDEQALPGQGFITTIDLDDLFIIDADEVDSFQAIFDDFATSYHEIDDSYLNSASSGIAQSDALDRLMKCKACGQGCTLHEYSLLGADPTASMSPYRFQIGGPEVLFFQAKSKEGIPRHCIVETLTLLGAEFYPEVAASAFSYRFAVALSIKTQVNLHFKFSDLQDVLKGSAIAYVLYVRQQPWQFDDTEPGEEESECNDVSGEGEVGKEVLLGVEEAECDSD